MSEYERESKLEVLNTILKNFQKFEKDNISINLQEFEHDDNKDMAHNYKIILDSIKTIAENIDEMQDIVIESEFSPFRSEPSYDDYRKAA